MAQTAQFSAAYLDELRSVCRTACSIARSNSASVGKGWFHADDFREALQASLGSRAKPDRRACRRLLRTLPFLAYRGSGWAWFNVWADAVAVTSVRREAK